MFSITLCFLFALSLSPMGGITSTAAPVYRIEAVSSHAALTTADKFYNFGTFFRYYGNTYISWYYNGGSELKNSAGVTYIIDANVDRAHAAKGTNINDNNGWNLGLIAAKFSGVNCISSIWGSIASADVSKVCDCFYMDTTVIGATEFDIRLMGAYQVVGSTNTYIIDAVQHVHLTPHSVSVTSLTTYTVTGDGDFLGGFKIGDLYYFLKKDTTIKFCSIDMTDGTKTTINSWTTTDFGASTLVGALIYDSTRDMVYYVHYVDGTNGIDIISFSLAGVYNVKQIITADAFYRCCVIASSTVPVTFDGIAYQLSAGGNIYIWRFNNAGFLIRTLHLPVTSNLCYSIGSEIFTNTTQYTSSQYANKVLISDTTYADFLPENPVFYEDQLCGQKFQFTIDALERFISDKSEFIRISDQTASKVVIYGSVLSENDGTYVIVSGAEADFSKKITVSWTASKSHEMLNEIITNECQWLNGTIADDSFANWAYSAKDVEIRKIIQDIMNHELHLFLHNYLNTCDFIADPLSGAPAINLDNTNINDFSMKTLSYAISEVRLTGKWDTATGDYLRSVWVITPNFAKNINILSDDFPLIDDQDALDDQAEKIGTMRSNQVLKISLEVSAQDLIEYGTIINVCYPIKNIGTENADYTPATYEKFMVTRSAQNENGDLFIEAISAFVFTRGREGDPTNLAQVNKMAVSANERVEKLATSLAGAEETHTILLKDNEAAALDIKEGSNSYIKAVTTNLFEQVAIGQNVTIANTGLFKSTAAGNVFKTTADGSLPTGYNQRASYEPTTSVIAASQTTHTKVLKIEHTTNSDYGLCAFPLSTDYKTAVTVEVWIYHATGTGNFTRFALTATDYTVEGFGIQLQSDGRVQLTNAAGTAYANLDQFVSAGWHHYKLVYNSNATSYLYIDGVFALSQTAWNNSTPKALLIELGSYKLTTSTSTSYFDAIALSYETGYVTWMGWADGQLNAQAIVDAELGPIPMQMVLRNKGYGATFWDGATSLTGSWVDINLAAFVPSWATWVLIFGTAQGGVAWSAYSELSMGGNRVDDRMQALYYNMDYKESWIKMSADFKISAKNWGGNQTFYWWVKGYA